MYNNPQEVSLLDQIFNDEFNTFVEKTTVMEPISDSSHIFIFEEQGAVISPVNPQTSTFNELVTKKGVLNNKKLDLNSSVTLFEDVTKKMLTLEGLYTIKEAIVLIEQFIKKAGKNFYGALLRNPVNKDIIINPYHPLTAINILTNSTYKTTKFTIILYFYNNRKLLDTIFLTNSVKVKTAKSSINKLLRLTKPFTEGLKNIKKLEKEVDKSLQLVQINWAIELDIDDFTDLNYSYYLLSHQLLTRGMIAPYYGSSILAIEPGEQGKCAHISPFLGVNISRGNPVPTDRAEYNGVCTGSQPGNTLAGLASLNHANLSSAMNKNTIRAGALVYADVCIDITRELYAKTGYLESYTLIAQDVDINKEHILAVKKDRQAFAEQLIKEGKSFVEVAEYIKQLQGIINDENSSTSTN